MNREELAGVKWLLQEKREEEREEERRRWEEESARREEERERGRKRVHLLECQLLDAQRNRFV